MRRIRLIVGDDHLIRIDELHDEIDVIGAMMRNGCTGASHVAGLLRPDRNDLPPSVPQSFRQIECAKRIRDRDPRLLQQNRKRDGAAIGRIGFAVEQQQPFCRDVLGRQELMGI